MPSELEKAERDAVIEQYKLIKILNQNLGELKKYYKCANFFHELSRELWQEGVFDLAETCLDLAQDLARHNKQVSPQKCLEWAQEGVKLREEYKEYQVRERKLWIETSGTQQQPSASAAAAAPTTAAQDQQKQPSHKM